MSTTFVIWINLLISFYINLFKKIPLAKKTEQRILVAALTCFNETGYFNVILKQIADSANMSVGNMVYHYPHKVELLHVFLKEWINREQLLLTDLHLTPIFENFDNFLQATFNLQQQYKFIYLDQLELIRQDIKIKECIQDYFQSQQDQLEILLSLYLARGVLRIKDQDIAYIALKVRRIINNWLRQQFIEGNSNITAKAFQLDIWSELKHYFTEIGLAEYRETTILAQHKT